MLNNFGTLPEKSRVLFTGNGELVIDDLMEHLPKTYKTEKCPPIEPDFTNAVKRFRPHTIVVCLANESRNTMRMYSNLESNPENYTLPVLAIGNEEDCDVFKKNVLLKITQTFVRPLNAERFFEALKKYVTDRIEDVKKREAAATAVEPEKIPVLTVPASSVVKEKSLELELEELMGNTARKTILVVDDDVRMLNVIKLYLQELYDIVVVPSGKLALKYLSKKSADLVLLDYMMPVDNGPEVLRQIRENSPHPHIPVIFLTGVADKDLVMRGLELRPNGYLLKPVTREALLEKATEVLLGL